MELRGWARSDGRLTFERVGENWGVSLHYYTLLLREQEEGEELLGKGWLQIR